MTIHEGATVRLVRSGQVFTVGALLGEGSQGSVHELLPIDGSSRRLALKWYFPVAGTRRQRATISELVERGSPGAMFLWPSELVVGEGGEFGYVMPLRPERFSGLADLLLGRVDVSLGSVVRLCLGLSHGFLSLHAQGLCYRDISFGNVFFNTVNGEPLICDNDNVGVDGESEAGVLGTRRFMAPEIVRGETMPSTQTDLYSLAVLIFYVLLVHHPLLGRRELDHLCLDREAEDQLFGADPLFIFDPDDHSNAPDPVEHPTVIANWSLIPVYLRDLFVQSFGPGLAHPLLRVRESVWRAALARLLDGVATCTWCGRENFSDDGVVGECWSCGREMERPLRLVLDGRVLVLGTTTRLCRHHVARDYDYTTALGEVVKHAERDIWGLRNVSHDTWHVTVPGRGDLELAPGQTLALVPGTVLHIGLVTARLED